VQKGDIIEAGQGARSITRRTLKGNVYGSYPWKKSVLTDEGCSHQWNVEKAGSGSDAIAYAFSGKDSND